jgi:transcriptional regulator with XRE-family HTH domain
VATDEASGSLPFASLLKRDRKVAQISQEELAERAGFSAVYISMLERGARQPIRTTVALLADALGLSAEERTALEAAAGLPAPPIAARARTSSSDAPAIRWPVGGVLGARPEGPLVAREAERARLHALLDEVAGGAGRMVLLAGEPGIGKTRLAQEVMQAALDRRFLVATGRCYAPQAVVAYYPFLEALTHAYAVAPAAIRAEVPRCWPEVARLLPDQDVGVSVRGATGAGEMGHGRDDQQRLFWQVTSFLQALAAEQPVALLLDDLHWADGASLDLVQHLARRTRDAALLLLGTYREEEVDRQHPLDAAVRDLGREQLVERIEVRRLSQEGTRDLIAVAIGAQKTADAIADALAHQLYGRTEGVPFFVYAMVRELAQRGALVPPPDGRWEGTASDEIAVPESVRSVIGQRLAHLAADSLEVLRAASVLGQAFGFADLQAMGGRSEMEVETALEAARSARLVQEMGRDGYAFDHALTQQALYGELSARQRRRLHRAAGAAIARLAAEERERRAAELAYRYVEAGEGARALPYALHAGDQAEAVYAHAEAEQHFRTALELAQELGDQVREAEALEKLGRALDALRRPADALDAHERAAQAYQTLGDTEGELRALAAIATGHSNVSTERAEVALVRVLPRLSALEAELAAGGESSSRALVAVYCSMAWLYDVLFRWREADAVAARAEQLARALGDPTLLVQALTARTWMNQSLEPGNSLGLADELIALAEAAGSHQGLWLGIATAYNHYVYNEADFAQARRYVERLLKLSERPQAQPDWGDALDVSGELAYYRSEWPRARDLCVQRAAIVQSADPSNTSWRAIYPPLWSGMVDLNEGHETRAVQHLAVAIARAEGFDDVQALTLAQSALAERDLLAGQATDALARLTPLVESREVRVAPLEVAQLLPLLAWAELETHLASTAGSAIRVFRPNALRVRALVAIAQGRCAQAETALEEAVARAHGMPYPHAEAKALYVYGKLHAAKGEPDLARGKYEAALSICKRLGEGLYRPYIERALADLGAP